MRRALIRATEPPSDLVVGHPRLASDPNAVNWSLTPIWLLLPRFRGVFFRAHECVLLASVRQAELDHPPIAVGRGVDQGRLLVEPIVDFDDFASERRIELRYGFHRFDGAEHVVFVETRPDLWQLDVDDVAELALRVVRDADRDDITSSPAFTYRVPRCTAGPSEFRTRRAP